LQDDGLQKAHTRLMEKDELMRRINPTTVLIDGELLKSLIQNKPDQTYTQQVFKACQGGVPQKRALGTGHKRQSKGP